MKKVSVSLEPAHVDRLDERQEAGEATSRSAALRQILDEYDRLRTEYEELRTECEELQNRLEAREDRVDALEEQLARRSQIEEKVDVLAKRVEESQLTYAEKRQRMIDRASLAERLRWRVTGVPVDEYDDE
jgi:chromosome segregation ATPase